MTKDEIVKIDAQIEILNNQMSPDMLRAINTLRTAVVPKEDIKKHPGKSGKTFSYIPHTIATDTMNDALGMCWDWQILDYQLFADKSAAARGQMTINYKDREGVERQRIITEVGGYMFQGENPVLANVVLAACSRALLRCMFRAFGYGRELYSSDEGGLSPEQVWKILEQYANNKKVKKDDLIAAIKEAGITKVALVDRFEEAYMLIQKLANPETVVPIS